MLVAADYNDITGRIVGAAIEVHRHLGPGLLESSYLVCLESEFVDRHISFARQCVVPIVYKGRTLNSSYQADFIVDDLIVVELKAVEQLLPVHHAQLLTYLRLANCPVGLLINFNVAKLTDGVKRVLNPRATRGVRAPG